MSQSLVPSDCSPTPPDAARMQSRAEVLCPLPALPDERKRFDNLTGDLCSTLATEGCPLASLLDERLQFETFLAELSAAFVSQRDDKIDNQIESALRHIVEFLDVDRGAFMQYSEDKRQALVRHSYAAPGFPPYPFTILDGELPWYLGKIREGQVLRFSRLPEELPPEAEKEREFCLRQGLKSHLMIPLKLDGLMIGVIGFGCFRRYRDWPDELVQRLWLVGEIFTNSVSRKQAKERNLDLRDQLTRMARVTTMGELAATIAHEINQPLCAIVSNSQAAQRLLTGDAADLGEVRETLQDIVADSLRASEVIARIRGLFQKHDPERKPLDLNDAIGEVLALLKSQLMRTGVTLALDLGANFPPVLGDRVQLQQVILNLALNGIEAISHAEPEQRELSVRSARDHAGTFTVSVRDSGPGIAAEQVEQVFDAFFTTKPGGIGIGLAISRSIIEAHGGRIWAEASAGRGAAFHFTLPASRPDHHLQGGAGG